MDPKSWYHASVDFVLDAEERCTMIYKDGTGQVADATSIPGPPRLPVFMFVLSLTGLTKSVIL